MNLDALKNRQGWQRCGIRIKNLNPNQTQNPVKIGKPENGDIVIAALFENRGRNSLVKLEDGGAFLELRPYESPAEFHVEPPFCLDFALTVKFETENQQQYDADGSRDAVDEAETDITEPDAVYHRCVLVEVYVKNVC